MSEVATGGPFSPGVDDDEAPAHTPPVPWIAAYAMGIVASGRHEYGATELLEHAAGDAQALFQASRHLEREQVGDPDLRRDASRLLSAAAARARRTNGPDLVIHLDP